MNDTQADDYNGPTFNCPNCDGRHPLDGSEPCSGPETATDAGDTRHEPYERCPDCRRILRVNREEPCPCRDEADDGDFEFVQGEDISDDLHDVAVVTTPNRVIGCFPEHYVEALHDSPHVRVIEDVASPVERVYRHVQITVPVEADR